MREEVIRVEHGCFQRENLTYRFDISISRGECVGVYVDDHLTSGTAYLDVFKGGTHMKSGRAFTQGRRVGTPELERWLQQNSMIVDKHRFDSGELTVGDFVVSLGKLMNWRQRKSAEERLREPESVAVLGQMGLNVPPEMKLAELSRLDYYRLCAFRVWFWEGGLLLLDRLTEILRQRDVEKLMQCVRLQSRVRGVRPGASRNAAPGLSDSERRDRLSAGRELQHGGQAAGLPPGRPALGRRRIPPGRKGLRPRRAVKADRHGDRDSAGAAGPPWGDAV